MAHDKVRPTPCTQVSNYVSRAENTPDLAVGAPGAAQTELGRAGWAGTVEAWPWPWEGAWGVPGGWVGWAAC